MNELPAEPLAASFFWTWFLPAVVFAVAAGATWMLYQHFSKQGSEHTSTQSHGDDA